MFSVAAPLLCLNTDYWGCVCRGQPNFSREQQGDTKSLDSTCFAWESDHTCAMLHTAYHYETNVYWKVSPTRGYLPVAYMKSLLLAWRKLLSKPYNFELIFNGDHVCSFFVIDNRDRHYTFAKFASSGHCFNKQCDIQMSQTFHSFNMQFLWSKWTIDYIFHHIVKLFESSVSKCENEVEYRI